MSPFERWLIAVSLNLLIWPAAIRWKQYKSGETLALGPVTVTGLVPGLVSLAGVALFASDLLYVYA